MFSGMEQGRRNSWKSIRVWIRVWILLVFVKYGPRVGAGVRVGVGAGVGVKGRGCRRNPSTAPYPHAADCLLGAGPGGSVRVRVTRRLSPLFNPNFCQWNNLRLRNLEPLQAKESGNVKKNSKKYFLSTANALSNGPWVFWGLQTTFPLIFTFKMSILMLRRDYFIF